MWLAHRLSSCAVLIVIIGLSLAGCGTAARTGPPTVVLSLTAPTTGATVGVRTIDVAGTVRPTQSVVKIAGRRVHVTRHGSFSSSIRLSRATTRIRIVARARGYVTARTQTTVRYSAATANGMRVALHAATDRNVGATTGIGFDTGPQFGSPAGRADYMANCNISTGGAGGTAACTCLYNHLNASGAFSTRAKEAALYQRAVTAVTRNSMSGMPISLRSSFVACAPLIFQTSRTAGRATG